MFIRDTDSTKQGISSNKGGMNIHVGKQEQVERDRPEILIRVDGIQQAINALENDAHEYMARLSPVTRESDEVNRCTDTPSELATTELSQMLLSIQRRIEALRSQIYDATIRLAV
jgi:hypothetical protein